MKRTLRSRVLAEFLGTYAIVFFGCGSIATIGNGTGIAGHLTVNLVFGSIVAAMIYALGPLSAAHFNPAVTLGFAAAGRFPVQGILPYLAAQFTGAILASGTHALLFAEKAEAVHYGATLPTVPLFSVLGTEGILTFFLMLVIIAVATDRRMASPIPGLAIGLTVALCGLFGGPLTGCSMNPARSLAPALFARGDALHTLWPYFLAPVLGAVLAARIYEFLRENETDACNAPADLAA